MNLKTKAVVVKPNRRTRTYILKEDEVKQGFFVQDKTVYQIDPNRMMLTDGRSRLGGKEVYTTFYYREGSGQPLPFPDFPLIRDMGHSSEKVRALFTPWFYRTIAPQELTLWDKLSRLSNWVSIVLSVVLLVMISTLTAKLNDANEILNQLVEALK